jgi:hypothetical protein
LTDLIISWTQEHMTKLKCWIILIWLWLLLELYHQDQVIEISLNCHILIVYVWMLFILGQNWHGYLLRCDIDFGMIRTVKVIYKIEFHCFLGVLYYNIAPPPPFRCGWFLFLFKVCLVNKLYTLFNTITR